MPQSLHQVLIHIVFSTKGRYPWLKKPYRAPLHAYMAATVRQFEGCQCFRVGGVEDHVHLAIGLARTITIADLVSKVKSNSSRWIKDQDPSLRQFAWQGGYAVFSANYMERERLLNYIDGQEAHHRKVDPKQEYLAFLKEHDIVFDERYVWD